MNPISAHLRYETNSGNTNINYQFNCSEMAREDIDKGQLRMVKQPVGDDEEGVRVGQEKYPEASVARTKASKYKF